MVINRMCFWQITPVLCVRYNQSHRTPNQQPEGTNVLTIHYGDMENVIYNTSVYFDNVYSPQWFQDAFAQRIIKGSVRPGLTYMCPHGAISLTP